MRVIEVYPLYYILTCSSKEKLNSSIPYFIDKEDENQAGDVTCIGSHSKLAAEPSIELGSLHVVCCHAYGSSCFFNFSLKINQKFIQWDFTLKE